MSKCKGRGKLGKCPKGRQATTTCNECGAGPYCKPCARHHYKREHPALYDKAVRAARANSSNHARRDALAEEKARRKPHGK